MANVSRIYLIVMGLPVNIQNILDNEKITNTDLLMNNIKMYDTEYYK